VPFMTDNQSSITKIYAGKFNEAFNAFIGDYGPAILHKSDDKKLIDAVTTRNLSEDCQLRILELYKKVKTGMPQDHVITEYVVKILCSETQEWDEESLIFLTDMLLSKTPIGMVSKKSLEETKKAVENSKYSNKNNPVKNINNIKNTLHDVIENILNDLCNVSGKRRQGLYDILETNSSLLGRAMLFHEKVKKTGLPMGDLNPKFNSSDALYDFNELINTPVSVLVAEKVNAAMNEGANAHYSLEVINNAINFLNNSNGEGLSLLLPTTIRKFMLLSNEPEAKKEQIKKNWAECRVFNKLYGILGSWESQLHDDYDKRYSNHPVSYTEKLLNQAKKSSERCLDLLDFFKGLDTSLSKNENTLKEILEQVEILYNKKALMNFRDKVDQSYLTKKKKWYNIF